MNILVVTYWSYKEPLIQAATLPYLRMIRELQGGEGSIHLLTLEKEGLRMEDEEAREVSEALEREGILLLRRRYHKFGLRAMLAWTSNLLSLVRYTRRNKIDALHAFGSPAATSAQVISRITGLPYVIDSYEPHAESMVENGSWSRNSLAYRVLRSFERMQAGSAKAVLATTEGMRAYAAKTYGQIPGVFVVRPACVDALIFNPDRAFQLTRADLGIADDAVVCVYAGKLGGIYLKEEIFDFFRACRTHWGERFEVLMLSDLSPDELKTLIENAGLDASCVTLRFVAHEEVPAYLNLADFAINPVKPVPSKRYCTSIKDGEYWSMGLPVVIPKGISDDSELIREEGIGVVLDDLNDEAYQKAVIELEALLHASAREGESSSQKREALKAQIRDLAVQHRGMAIARRAYARLYGVSGALMLPEKHFLVLIYNSFKDPLFQNLVFAYMREQSRRHANYHFELITFEQRKYALSKQERKATKALLSGERIAWHPLTYHSGWLMFVKKAFDISSAFVLSARIRLRKRIDLVIAFANTSAAISLLIAKFLRTKMMVYSFEPHSEFLAEFGTWNRHGWRYRVLNGLEERVAREADYILTGTSHMRERLLPAASGQVYRAPSSVDETLFRFCPEARKRHREGWQVDDRKVLVYAGKFGGIYYDREIAAFCKALAEGDPGWYFLILTPSPADAVQQLFEEAGMHPHQYRIDEAIGAEAMRDLLSAADMGLTAIPPYPNQKYRSPVKVGEYLLCGLPYITCRGVSEDDAWAEREHVGIVVPHIAADVAVQVQNEAEAFFAESPEALRERCRKAGIAYRGRAQVDALFEQILDEV